MANDFLERDCKPQSCDCQSNRIETVKPYLGYPTGDTASTVDFPYDPLPFNRDFLASQYVVSTATSDLAESIVNHLGVSATSENKLVKTPDGGYQTPGARTGDEKTPSPVPTVAEIAQILQSTLNEIGASSSVDVNKIAINIHNALTSSEISSGSFDGPGAIATVAAMIAGAVNGGFGDNGAVGVVTVDDKEDSNGSVQYFRSGTTNSSSNSSSSDSMASRSAGLSARDGGGEDSSSSNGISPESSAPPSISSSSGGGGGGGGGGDNLREPADKALEFLNDLEFLFKELESKQGSASTAVCDVKYPFNGHISLMTSMAYEALSNALSTYDGYREEITAIHFPTAFPQVSQPGVYSFEDNIETMLDKVKRMSLKSITLAQVLLSLIPTLFTFDPNRTREANRRCRTLKHKLYKKIAMLPTMLDLWDGIGEWTTVYNIAENIDHQQLFFESRGGYLRETNMTPRLVRKSVARKNFSEDRILDQSSYNTVNDFFQYCMTDAYSKEEYVENSFYFNYRLEWDHAKQRYVFQEDEHPGIPTTTYKTQNLRWVGEKLKGDAFFNTVIMRMAQPFDLMYAEIKNSVPLIEYLYHKAEITTIKTYDWNTRVDFRRMALTDYRGFKRMNEFKRLDRSGLDVISNE